jgi:hypothetical protein
LPAAVVRGAPRASRLILPDAAPRGRNRLAANGLSDSHLVATLRADGTSVPGLLVDVPGYSSDSSGKVTITDIATL